MLPSVEVLLTTRIAQLTGSTSASNPTWPESVDPMGWPLLNDTGRWGVTGVDLGANTEHSDGRLYFFFGDVAVESDEARPGYSGDWRTMKESDLVAWTDDREIFRCGGHLEQGWNFLLPNDEQGAGETTGQPDWRFCVRCGGLFHAPNGNTSGSVCPKRGEHAWFGKKFFLPNDHQAAGDATGQRDWRFCRNCHGLFWAPGDRPAGACPRGGQHDPLGCALLLPNDSMGANDAVGQRDWRFCRNCHGLFWAGSGFKGTLPRGREPRRGISPARRRKGRRAVSRHVRAVERRQSDRIHQHVRGPERRVQPQRTCLRVRQHRGDEILGTRTFRRPGVRLVPGQHWESRFSGHDRRRRPLHADLPKGVPLQPAHGPMSEAQRSRATREPRDSGPQVRPP